MTEELEQKAKDFIDRIGKECGGNWLDKYYLTDLLVMFATENGIQWHDLRKDPNDLPKTSELFYDVSERVIGVQEVAPRQFMSIECRYDLIEKKWRISQDPYYADVIAWCEIPQFKE